MSGGAGIKGRLPAERPFCIGRIAWHTTRLDLYWSPETGPLAAAMKAHQLIACAAFDPAQLKSMKQAFDDAWEQIAPQISTRPKAIDAARFRLAQLVLSVAKRGILERDKLKAEALKLMHAAQAAKP